MKHSIFMMVGSILPLALLGRFGDTGPLFAQARTETSPPEAPESEQSRADGPRMGPSTMGQGIPGLADYVLPGGAVSETDMPGIQAGIEQVLAALSAAATGGGGRVDNETIRASLLTLQGWLQSQGCVAAASSTYDLGNVDGYDQNIFLTHPGQVPFDIVFRMAGGEAQAYRLLLFVTTYELFNFGSLVKNNAEQEVFIPENWPEDAPAYWESRS